MPCRQSVQCHEAIEAFAPGRSQLVIVSGSGYYTAFNVDCQSSAVLAFRTDTLG